MMISKSTLITACVFAIAGAAAAQVRQLDPMPVTTQVKDAGTYHLSTGTWTRGQAAAAMAGPEVIYDNTCMVGFYFGASQGDVIFDSGRVPSTNSPSNASSLTGLYDLYEVDGFQIGYCSFQPLATSIDISFTDCYAACDTNGGLPTPIAVFHLLNMPAGTTAGGIGCWLVSIDLSNTTLAFNLGGDCEGLYNNTPSTDSFGWSWTEASPTTGGNAGPIFAGDPSGFFNTSCGTIGDGTTFVGSNPTLPGTGIGILDQMELGNGPTAPGCYWFGGYSAQNPYTAFFLQVQGGQRVVECNGPGAPFCMGDGTGTACPCGNDSAYGLNAGCRNSGFYGARLYATGCAENSPGQDSLSFHVSGVQGVTFGLLLRGNNAINGGMGNPIGDGLLCTGGGSQRSQVQQTDAFGVTHFADFNGGTFGSVSNGGAIPTHFQFWYRDNSGPCGSGFNFSNGWTVNYTP